MPNTVPAFFYGLYMDCELLLSLGFKPGAVKKAKLDNYAIDLHGLAKIIPNNNSVVWGNVITLSEADLTAMYSFESTKSYKAENIHVTDIDGNVVMVSCYNIHATPDEPFNLEYQKKLLPLLQKLAFPANYVNSIEALK